jgi:hypothetical protein
LRGEADLASAGALHRALTALPPEAAPFHLHLAGLEFADVAATRELIILTQRPARPVVILYDPPYFAVCIIRRLLCPDALDRFRICTEQPAPAADEDP